ncbi:MAG: hypothetical protein ACI80S_000273 [Pseudohongiellaceae bacterium]|jgi:hypothetical protein
MISFKQQKGLSSIGWLFVITVFGVVFTVVAKLAPFYLDNRFVVSTLQGLAEDAAFPQMTPNQVRAKLRKTFTVNNVRGKAVDSVKVNKVKNTTLVTIEYEERINILFNVDVVLTFNSLLDSSRPEQCCSASAE